MKICVRETEQERFEQYEQKQRRGALRQHLREDEEAGTIEQSGKRRKSGTSGNPGGPTIPPVPMVEEAPPICDGRPWPSADRGGPFVTTGAAERGRPMDDERRAMGAR